MGSHQAIAFLLVFIGGGIGSMLRHAANLIGTSLFGLNIPAGTLFVNITGSLAMGLLAGWVTRSAHAATLSATVRNSTCKPCRMLNIRKLNT